MEMWASQENWKKVKKKMPKEHNWRIQGERKEKSRGRTLDGNKNRHGKRERIVRRRENVDKVK